MTIKALVENLIGAVFDGLIALAFVVGIIVFFYGIVVFIFASRNGDSREIDKGKNLILWGIIALFIMTSFIGIINLFGSAVGLK